MNYTAFKESLSSYCQDRDTFRAILSYVEELPETINYQDILSRIKLGEPIQYITSKAYFHRYHLKVSPATLIPRPETEELCEWILKEQPKSELSILDIGTGSACIPITLLLERPQWTAVAIDISEEALRIANDNAHYHNVANRIQFQQIDVLVTQTLPKARVWVSNPPYISLEEKKSMHKNVLDYEPHIALFAGENPLIFYQKMAQLFVQDENAFEFWLELNQYYADEILSIFLSYNLEAKKIEDFSGNPRFLKALKTN